MNAKINQHNKAENMMKEQKSKPLLVCGDSRNLIRTVPEDAILISDPPYNQGYHYDAYRDSLEEREYKNLLLEIFRGRRAVIILYPEQIVNLLGGGLLGRCQEVVSWVYNSNTAKQHRLVTWWNCRPDFRKIGQPYKNPTDKRIRQRIAEGKMARLYDWWEINQVKNVSKQHSHPCPIPLELARRIILITTEPGDTVVDPFCGIGTVVKAATDEGRHGIGFDIDPKYIAEAQEMMK